MQNFKNGFVPVADNKASSLFNLAQKELVRHYNESEKEIVIFWLLERFADISKSDFLTNPHILVNQSSIILFCNAVDQLKEGKPIQYVVGEVEFYGLKLLVDGSVLIPRPETEELVDLIVKENVNNPGLRILDIGTGSGCIALSLASELQEPQITAIDVSKKALVTATKNAEKNKISGVELVEMNILDEDFLVNCEYDIIVSNPPYIAAYERSTMAKNVLEYEPELALFVTDQNSLVFYNRIVELAKDHLRSNGKVYVEINERFGEETKKLFLDDIFNSVELLNDMFGKNRFIKAVKI